MVTEELSDYMKWRKGQKAYPSGICPECYGGLSFIGGPWCPKCHWVSPIIVPEIADVDTIGRILRKMRT